MAAATVVEGGRIIVPAAFRKSMGLSKGDTVFMELHGDELRIRPARSALRRIQAKLRALAPNEGFVSDELMAERCRRKAKMSALSKVKLSVSCPSGSGNGGCGTDERGADEQTRAEPDRCFGPP